MRRLPLPSLVLPQSQAADPNAAQNAGPASPLCTLPPGCVQKARGGNGAYFVCSDDGMGHKLTKPMKPETLATLEQLAAAIASAEILRKHLLLPQSVQEECDDARGKRNGNANNDSNSSTRKRTHYVVPHIEGDTLVVVAQKVVDALPEDSEAATLDAAREDERIQNVEDQLQAIVVAMHTLGFFHNDLTPANVMVSCGEDGTVFLIDFENVSSGSASNGGSDACREQFDDCASAVVTQALTAAFDRRRHATRNTKQPQVGGMKKKKTQKKAPRPSTPARRGSKRGGSSPARSARARREPHSLGER